MNSAADNAKLVRKACQKAFCMSYVDFLKLRSIPDNYYAREKYQQMQKNFSRYFCELDSVNATKFMEGL
jgi:hypothetical protein